MENLENKKYWIWFSLIKGLGCVRKNKLLKIYGTPEEIYKLSKSELLKIDGIGDETVKNIIEAKNEKILKKDNSQPFLRLYNYAQKYRQNYIEKYNDSNYNGIEQCVFTSERSNHIVNSKKALYVVVPRSV